MNNSDFSRKITLLSKSSERLGNASMTAKIVFWLSFWSCTWLIAIYAPVSDSVRLIAGVFHIVSHLFIALNIGHDANHNAITSNLFIREILKRSFDLVGISSYCWRKNHNGLHHHYTSIKDKDVTADGRTIMRFTNSAPWKFFHRYQYLYAPVIYSAVVLNYIFIRDFLDFGRYLRKSPTDSRIWMALAECLVFKIFYIGYMIILPITLYPDHKIEIVTLFILTQFILGQLIIVIQVPHFNMNTKSVSEENVSREWDKNLEFVLKHSSDLAPFSPFWNWALGGINLHIIHHIAPEVCHIHYPELTKELSSYCRQENKAYTYYNSVWDGYLSHYGYLKTMGQKE